MYALPAKADIEAAEFGGVANDPKTIIPSLEIVSLPKLSNKLADPPVCSANNYDGAVHMKSRLINAFLATIAILAFSSSAYAGCSKAQVSGIWEVAFSDGNSCRLKLNNVGKIITGSSVCFDPTLGAAPPDSGTLPVKGNCLADGQIVIQGVIITLAIQFATDRNTGGGRYFIEATSAKGSVIMIRVP